MKKLLVIGFLALGSVGCYEYDTGPRNFHKTKLLPGIQMTESSGSIYMVNLEPSKLNLKSISDQTSSSIELGNGASKSGLTIMNGKAYYYSMNYGAEQWNCNLRAFDLSSQTTSEIKAHLCLSQPNATRSDWRFSPPNGLTNDGTYIYASNVSGSVIHKYSSDGSTSAVFAGSTAETGAADGQLLTARFKDPAGIAYYAGKIYVADAGNHTIRVIDITTETVTTIAGSPGNAGSDDGVGSGARFNRPMGVHTNDGVHLYVADTDNHLVRKIKIEDGKVETIAGVKNVGEDLDGEINSARLESPAGVIKTDKGLFISNGSGVRRLF